VNDWIKSGIHKATDAAWEKLPEILTASIVALVVFGGGLWLDLRDTRHALQSVMAEQQPPRFCERIGVCNVRTSGARGEDELVWVAIAGMRQTLNEREIRIQHLEDKVYEISNKPSARADPFTGTEGRELDQRIRTLEGKR